MYDHRNIRKRIREINNVIGKNYINLKNSYHEDANPEGNFTISKAEALALVGLTYDQMADRLGCGKSKAKDVFTAFFPQSASPKNAMCVSTSIGKFGFDVLVERRRWRNQALTW